MGIAEDMAIYRKENKLSYKKLSGLVGISAQYLFLIERKRTEPRDNTIEKIRKVIGGGKNDTV